MIMALFEDIKVIFELFCVLPHLFIKVFWFIHFKYNFMIKKTFIQNVKIFDFFSIFCNGDFLGDKYELSHKMDIFEFN